MRVRYSASNTTGPLSSTEVVDDADEANARLGRRLGSSGKGSSLDATEDGEEGVDDPEESLARMSGMAIGFGGSLSLPSSWSSSSPL